MKLTEKIEITKDELGTIIKERFQLKKGDIILFVINSHDLQGVEIVKAKSEQPIPR